MAKISFDVKYRQQIESGEYKVITAKEQPVRIICWDRSTTYWKIIALVLAPDGKTENPFTYDVNGKESDGCLHNHELDLFVITPEPELNESEDERIRRELIEFLNGYRKTHDVPANKVGWIIETISWLEKQKEQKLAKWSENDKRILDEAIGMIEARGCWVRSEDAVKQVSNFLKSLPERFNLQSKQEWNEEDERMLSRCVKSIESSKQFAGSDTFKKAKDYEIGWLVNRFKSRRIDIIPEQPACEELDLEKEIIRYQREDMDRDTTIRDVARHFAEWKAENLKK